MKLSPLENPSASSCASNPSSQTSTNPHLRLRRPSAVLFDYDGVLVASEPIHLSAWMQLLDELGLPKDKQSIARLVGKTGPEILKTMLDLHRPGWDPTQYPLNELAYKKNNFYLEIARTELRPYPGVPQGLQWLKDHSISRAVVSNGKRREVETTLKALNLFHFFDEVITRDDVKAFKPDPTPYLLAAATLNVSIENCIAVEDSPTGMEAALMAKIPCAGILTNFNESTLKNPVPGRDDLRPTWIGTSMVHFFEWLQALPI